MSTSVAASTVARPAGTSRGRQRSTSESVRNAFLAAFIIMLAIYPFFDHTFNWQNMGAFPAILLFAILALGLNIVVGFAGLLDLGYAAFFAIGGYTTAFLTSPLSPLRDVIQVNFYVALACSWAMAALFGVILGAPTLRLRGDYLAIVTLAFGEIVPRTFLNLDSITYGSKGIKVIGRPLVPLIENGSLVFRQISNSDQTAWYYLIFVIGGVCVFVIRRLAQSRMGRAWMAMREDELAASAMGINLVQTKLLAFALGASFSGFAGALWASMLQDIDPSQFDFSISIIVLSMIILGGVGNIWGVVFGAAVLGFYDRVATTDATSFLHGIAGAVPVPFLRDGLQSVDIGQDKYLIFGLALVILMLTRPEGIFPNRQRAVELHGGSVESDTDQLSEDALVDRPLGGVKA